MYILFNENACNKEKEGFDNRRDILLFKYSIYVYSI